MEQAFGFGWEYLEKAAREQASHSCAKWGIVQSLEKMHFTQHQINGVERKANLASSCIFLWACFKTEFLEVMVYTSIKTTLPGREIIQKKKKKKETMNYNNSGLLLLLSYPRKQWRLSWVWWHQNSTEESCRDFLHQIFSLWTHLRTKQFLHP